MGRRASRPALRRSPFDGRRRDRPDLKRIHNGAAHTRDRAHPDGPAIVRPRPGDRPNRGRTTAGPGPRARRRHGNGEMPSPPPSGAGHAGLVASAAPETSGVRQFLGSYADRPRVQEPPACRDPVRAVERPPCERGFEAGPHLALRLGLGDEQDAHPHDVATAVGGRVVRSDRAGRLVLPVPAQRHRDRRTRGTHVTVGVHDDRRLMSESHTHPPIVVHARPAGPAWGPGRRARRGGRRGGRPPGDEDRPPAAVLTSAARVVPRRRSRGSACPRSAAGSARTRWRSPPARCRRAPVVRPEGRRTGRGCARPDGGRPRR